MWGRESERHENEPKKEKCHDWIRNESNIQQYFLHIISPLFGLTIDLLFLCSFFILEILTKFIFVQNIQWDRQKKKSNGWNQIVNIVSSDEQYHRLSFKFKAINFQEIKPSKQKHHRTNYGKKSNKFNLIFWFGWSNWFKIQWMLTLTKKKCVQCLFPIEHLHNKMIGLQILMIELWESEMNSMYVWITGQSF